LAHDELGHLRVAAPFDGVVTQRLVEVGESVVPGQAVLEVTSPERLYVSTQIDEIDIGRIRVGLPARVTLDPFPGQVWQAKVTRVSEVVNDQREQNRTLEVEVEIAFAADRPQPKPGTSADVQIVLDRHENVLRVPSSAVAEGRRVLIVRRGRAVAREVKTGLKNWEWTEVREGLREGEVVITSLDKQGVRAGARVVTRERGTARAAG
jgi:HlyD family secretion protein